MLITYKKLVIVIINITKKGTTHLDRKSPCVSLGTELILVYKFTFVSRMSWSLEVRAQEWNASFAAYFWAYVGPTASHQMQRDSQKYTKSSGNDDMTETLSLQYWHTHTQKGNVLTLVLKRDILQSHLGFHLKCYSWCHSHKITHITKWMVFPGVVPTKPVMQN